MAMAMANTNRVFEDFEPPSDLVKEQDCDIILVYLPGFRKEQFKVQLTPSRVLKVSGERPIGDKKWRRFQKEFVVSTNSDTKSVTAKFEGGILHIRQPKILTPPPPEPKPQPRPELQSPSPLPAVPERDEERRGEETAWNEHAKISDKGKETVRENRGEASEEQTREVVAAGIGLFKELRNPDNHKRIAVYVVMMILVVLYVLQLFKSLRRIDQESLIEYDKEL